MNNKEKMRKYHRPEESEETRRLNTIWYPGLDPGPEKDIDGKISDILLFKVIVMHPCWFLSFDKCALVM